MTGEGPSCGSRRGSLRVLWLVLPAAACGASLSPRDPGAERRERPAAESPSPPAQGPHSEREASETVSRALSPDTTFAELIQRISSLEGNARPTGRGCLFTTQPTLALSADLAPALRPLPAPPTEAPRLDGGVSILTRFGRLGAGAGALATLTTQPPPPAGGVVLFVAPGEVVLGHVATLETERLGEVAALRDSLPPREPRYVTALADVTLGRMLEVLQAVQAHSEGPAEAVVLAVWLPAGTELPPALELDPAPAPAPLCEALPSPDDGRAEGGYADLTELTSALSGAREQLGSCARGEGGRMSLLLRVGEQGRVEHVCATEDDTGDTALRACVVAGLRQLSLPAPEGPRGYVDLALPLVFDPVAPQRAVCGA